MAWTRRVEGRAYPAEWATLGKAGSRFCGLISEKKLLWNREKNNAD